MEAATLDDTRTRGSSTRPCPRLSALPSAGTAAAAAAPRTRAARSAPDKTDLAAHDPALWEHSVPVNAETESDWFLLHCARAYGDLAADLFAGGIPEPRRLAESVLFGYAVEGIGGFNIESVHTDDVDQTLPASRFDHDREFLADESGLVDVSDRAHDFLEADVTEEDFWDKWFEPCTNVEPRDTTRGFRC